ncbi:MAG TPA: SDR family NAD(P)-dependent oxidoreductase [Rhizomicrobium sp.]|jgi:NAD(P)-dependent dehydrogenase (short-subunit alcohol dehydrogenase family)|nr:SDR family NAD(P)-dependent oxidoreductase [Rhizomicrobium sp.]
MTSNLSGRIALVTGASRGIGRAAALALAKAGAHVILVARTVGGLEEADDEIQNAGGTATLVPMNLRDGEAIDRLGASIYERWGRLDAFLGNAGVLGQLTPLAHLEPKTFQEVMEVNVTANWRLIRSLDPLLRQSDAGRVLFVTSGAARKHTAYWGVYSMSKAALETLALTYAAECETTKIKVNLINPGPMRTAMRRKAMPGEDPATLPAPEDLAYRVVEMLSPAYDRNETVINFQR